MKKHLMLAGLIYIISASNISAQSRGLTKKNTLRLDPNPYTISISPSHFLISTLDVGIERKMNAQTGLMLRGNVGFRNLTLWEGLGGKYKNFGARLEARHYFKSRNEMLMGAYVTLWGSMNRASLTATIAKKEYELVSSSNNKIGAGLGWKFNLFRKFPGVNMDIQVGGGYKFGEVKGKYAEKSRSIIFKDNGFVPTIAVNIGFNIGRGTKSVKHASKGVIAPTTSAQAFHSKYTLTQRRQIEKALRKSGFHPGLADGIFTKKTIKAIKAFQKSNRLKSDGLIGNNTAHKLGLKFE